MRPNKHALSGGIVLLAVLGLLSCDRETITYLDPIYQVGALEGYVLVAGEPRAVTVGAREVESPGRVIARTQSRPDGWYRLELPVDRYRIEINPGSYGFYSPDTSDVVHVEPQTKRHDLLFSRLVMRVEVPDPLDGLWLSAQARETGRYAVYTSASGRLENPVTEYTFDYLDPGLFIVGIDLTDGARYYLPGTYDESEAQQFVVQADRQTVLDVSFAQHASISGSVLGSWQQAETVAPNVYAYNMQMLDVARTQVAEDGTYRLHLLIAEPVRVKVGRWNEVEQWIGGDSFETATVFDVRAGDSLGSVDLTESGIQVQLEGPGDFLTHRPRFVITDGEGWEFRIDNLQVPYSITNLLPGRYYLRVSHDICSGNQPWRPQWYSGAQSFEAAQPIDLASGQLQNITMVLENGGVIEGQVLLNPESPAALVVLFDSSGTSLCDYYLFADNGTFRFAGLADGDYLIAKVNGTDTWWYPGTTDITGASTIHVVNAQTVSDIVWSAEP